ncbi:hypothetical protein SMD44_08308 [Streptomyces alboflavus]|uniref:Uncharacterized protein n=1 Tax=Streptomyces alboflavus TaxID=67267 RepID=A0A1Z1WQU1_9ACTN|nr:hypothetical protein SMD44_08308 [Streptomyces alboflavus]
MLAVMKAGSARRGLSEKTRDITRSWASRPALTSSIRFWMWARSPVSAGSDGVTRAPSRFDCGVGTTTISATPSTSAKADSISAGCTLRPLPSTMTSFLRPIRVRNPSSSRRP